MSETPICDAARAGGQWNAAWDEAAALDPEWMERFLAMGTLPLRRGAVDASCTHLYAPGTRRHIAGALDKGATPEEVLAVLQAVAALGIHSVALGAPMLVEEIEKRGLSVADARREFPSV